LRILENITIKNNQIICDDYRIDKIEENIKFESYPFVFEIDHYSHILSNGEIIFFEEVEKPIACDLCKKKINLGMKVIRTREFKKLVRNR